MWRMAGKQLCYLKAVSCPMGGVHAVTEEMYAMLKPDPTYIKLILSEENELRYYEARQGSESRADEWVAELMEDDMIDD